VETKNLLSGIVKIAFTYLFILFIFMMWKFMSMSFETYLDYFAHFVIYFIPLGLPAWILFLIFSINKRKMFQPMKPQERKPQVRNPIVGGKLFSDEEIVKPKE